MEGSRGREGERDEKDKEDEEEEGAAAGMAVLRATNREQRTSFHSPIVERSSEYAERFRPAPYAIICRNE